MKRLFLILSIIALGSISAVSTEKRVLADPPEMITICHAAGQAGTTQFVTLTLPYVAVYGQAGHFNEDGTPQAGHEQDYLGACSEPSVTPTITPTPSLSPTPTPTDSITPTITVSPTPKENQCPVGQEWDSGLHICIDCDGGGTCEVVIGSSPTPTLSPTATPTPTQGQTQSSSDNNSSSSNGQVQGVSTSSEKKGEVLGTTTLAGTGAFQASLATAGQLIGFLLATSGIMMYGRKKFFKKS